MTSSDPTPRSSKGESALAFGIMFLAVALLTFMMGWADGVRHGERLAHFPNSPSWLVTTAVLLGIGVILVVWSRVAKRG